MDWVLIGNGIPNATFEIRNGGILGGSAVASGPVVSVKVDFPQIPVAGDVLEAVFRYQSPNGPAMVGPAAFSLPVTGARQPRLPAPPLRPRSNATLRFWSAASSTAAA